MPLRALVTSQLKKKTQQKSNFTSNSTYFKPKTSCTHLGLLPVFVMLQCCCFSFRYLGKLLCFCLQMCWRWSIHNQSYIGWGGGAVLSCHPRGALQFLQLPQRKKQNRQHRRPRNLGHIAVYWKQIGTGSCCRLFCQLCFPPNVPAIRSHSCRLTMFNFT